MNDRSQADIARAYGISRASVSRILAQARASGLVRVSVDVADGLCLSMEEALEREFGIRFAHVIPTADSAEKTLDALGAAVAVYLLRHLPRYRVIAVGWGRTIAHIARHVHRGDRRGADGTGEVVEMVGAFEAQSTRLQSMRLAPALAQRLGYAVALLNAPAIANDAAMCASFLEHDQIQQVLARARQADVAIASLGSVDTHSTLYRLGLIRPEELEAIMAAGARAEILGRFADERGAPIATSLDERLIGLSLEDLRRIPEVIVVAAGEEKRYAILAALRGRLMSHLFTDADTATWILNQRRSRAAGGV